MTGRRAIFGLCMLCALIVSAIAAQGASAAIAGTTTFTCKKPDVGDNSVGTPFTKEHCKDEDTDLSGQYRHVVFAQDTTTEVDLTNTTTGTSRSLAVLVSTQAGIEEELQAEVIENKPGTTAWMTNAKDPTTGEHYSHGEGVLTYTGVTVTKPAGKGCKVFGEGGEKTVATKTLKATTKGQGMGVKFEPAAGTVFSEFEIKECSVAALNGTYKAEGSLVATPDGATIVTTTAGIKAQGTLKLRGQVAGLGGSLTQKGKDPITNPGGPFTALSPTTVET